MRIIAVAIVMLLGGLVWWTASADLMAGRADLSASAGSAGDAVVNQSDGGVARHSADSDDSGHGNQQQPGAPTPTEESEYERHVIESEQTIREGMRAVAQAYREDMKFPPYSKPLRLNDTALLNPRAYPAVSLPVAGKSGIEARLELGAYIADIQQPLPVALVVTSKQPFSEAQALVSATITVKGSERIVDAMPLSMSFAGSDTQKMVGAVSPGVLVSAGAGEITLVAKMKFRDGSNGVALASAKTYEPVAELLGVESAWVEGPHLMIPMQFSVNKSGFYRVQANLFSEQGRAPVSHLSQVFEFSKESERGVMKAHRVTLEASGSEGPYLLSDVTLTRVPSRPGEPLAYGTAPARAWSVSGHEFDQYSDEPFLDPKAEQRLQFIESLQ